MRSTILLGCAFAAAVGWSAYGGQFAKHSSLEGLPGDSFSCTVGHIVDADTFDCIGGPRIRVAGINAAERDGSCRNGSPCVDVPESAARVELVRLVAGQTLTCEPNGADPYGRTPAFCRTPAGVDLSCAMLETGTVARWDRFWGGHRC